MEWKENKRYPVRNSRAKNRGSFNDYNNFNKITDDQHFLMDDDICKQIAGSLTNKTKVIEIGPGEGALTRFLLPHATSLIAIEKDPDLCVELHKAFSTDVEIGKLELIKGDALEIDYSDICKDGDYSLISNLPYSISEQIFYILLRENITEIVLTTGESFFDLLISDKKLGLYRKIFYDIEIITKVPRVAFNPMPKVESVCYKMTKKQPTIISGILAQHDKMLKNALLSELSKKSTKNEARKLIESLQIPTDLLEKRIIHLSNVQFKEVYEKLCILNKPDDLSE